MHVVCDRTHWLKSTGMPEVFPCLRRRYATPSQIRNRVCRSWPFLLYCARRKVHKVPVQENRINPCMQYQDTETYVNNPYVLKFVSYIQQVPLIGHYLDEILLIIQGQKPSSCIKTIQEKLIASVCIERFANHVNKIITNCVGADSGVKLGLLR